MAQFFVSLLGGAYCLVEHSSLDDLTDAIEATAGTGNDRFTFFARPDGKHVAINPRDVTLIQPPAPASFKHTDTKEN